MEFIKTALPDIILCKPTVHNDSRGYFFESYKENAWATYLGYTINLCQDNEAKSTKGVLRGLHSQ